MIMTQKCKKRMITVNKFVSIRLILPIVFTILNIYKISAQERSGIYSNSLVISVNDKNKQITGYLWKNIYVDDDIKKGIYFSCYLYFKGYYRSLNDTVQLDIFDSFDTLSIAKGKLDFVKNEILLTINKRITACQNVFDLIGGESFDLDKKIPIIYCGRIKSSKAHFYKNNTKSKSYLIKGDFVSILKVLDDNCFVQYYDKNSKLIEGWIKKIDVE